MNLVEAKERLAKAKGRSEHVMSIFMDIRGFSAFSKENESPNIAIYVKKLFLKVLQDYFSEATYAKPTGDGLLIIYPYDEGSLATVADKVVGSSLRCVEDFHALCLNEPMLNFSLPQNVGFGISRGLACCLYEGKTIIDYSGHILNLAARLNGVARPAGVVIDGSFLNSGLDQEFLASFERDHVYLKGVADESSVEILYQKHKVKVTDGYRKSLASTKWEEEKIEFEAKELKDVFVWRHNLPARADEAKGLKVKLSIPNPTKSNPDRSSLYELDDFKYEAEPRPGIEINMDPVKSIMASRRLASKKKIRVIVNWVAIS